MIFGSSARGDSDSISDQDILKVYDNNFEKHQQNNNIHLYTKKRLYILLKSESLFLVHLKKEGKILTDEENWLKDFLHTIPEFSASKDRISLVKNYLILLLSITPSEKQILWWYDCLYVFLRDYFIKYNSQHKLYSFSPYSFAKPIINYRELDLTNEVLRLREFKSHYRNNKSMDSFDLDYIRYLKEIVSKSLNINIKSSPLLEVYQLSDKKTEPYFKLRLIEGLYLNKEIQVIDDKILRFIRNPNLYNWEIKNVNLDSKIRIL